VSYPLAQYEPRTFALYTNMSLQAELAQDYVEGFMVAAVTLAVDLAVVAELEAAATSAATLAEAVATVNAAGWPNVALVVPPATVVADPSGYAALSTLGVRVVTDASATAPLVVAVDGVALIASGPDVLRQDDVALAGRQVGAWSAVQLSTGPGAVGIVSTA
jgi:hypothetical protein